MTTLADELLVILRAAVQPASGAAAPVFDGDLGLKAGDLPPRSYVVLYGDPGRRYHEDLAHTSDCYEFSWQITCVAPTRAEADWLVRHTRDALIDICPTVTGLVCGPIEHEFSQPVRRDEQIPNRTVMYGTDQYGLEATAAAA